MERSVDRIESGFPGDYNHQYDRLDTVRSEDSNGYTSNRESDLATGSQSNASSMGVNRNSTRYYNRSIINRNNRKRDQTLSRAFLYASIGLAGLCLIVLFLKDESASLSTSSSKSSTDRFNNLDTYKSHVHQQESIYKKEQTFINNYNEQKKNMDKHYNKASSRTNIQQQQNNLNSGGITGVKLSNEYTNTAPVDLSKYPGEWTAFAEPHKNTLLELQVDSSYISDVSDCDIKWTIAGPARSNGFYEEHEGSSINVKFTTTGFYDVEIFATCLSDSTDSASNAHNGHGQHPTGSGGRKPAPLGRGKGTGKKQGKDQSQKSTNSHESVNNNQDQDIESRKLQDVTESINKEVQNHKDEDLDVSTSNSKEYSYSLQVMNKYVRREIRALTEEDRNTFLDALQEIYTLSNEDGISKYGSNYKSITYFVKKHLYGAADRECDHWHDDAGIVTHHMAYTLEMEQALQVIDPSISIPYWEYTIDSFLENWEDSIVFDDDWMGTASPTNDDHVVDTGRWAFTPIASEASDFSHVYNPYNLLRSPWNTNPVPYFTRQHYQFGEDAFYWPGCSEFSGCYNSTSMKEMALCLNGYTHGPVHIKIGGEWGAPDAAVSVMEKYNFLTPFLLLVKNLWRHNFISCPTTCSDLNSTEDGSCECSVPDWVLGEKTPYEMLTKETGIMHQIATMSTTLTYSEVDEKYHVIGVSPEDEDEVWSLILDTMKTPYYAGEMYTSAAPYDPTFWIIHPTAERLLNAKRIFDADSFDQTFGYDHTEKAASDDGQVCDWTDVDESSEFPTCRFMTCDGHHSFDIIPFSKFIGTDLSYTNAQFYDFLHPYNEDLPYVYDNFLWTHCSNAGVDVV